MRCRPAETLAWRVEQNEVEAPAFTHKPVQSTAGIGHDKTGLPRIQAVGHRVSSGPVNACGAAFDTQHLGAVQSQRNAEVAGSAEEVQGPFGLCGRCQRRSWSVSVLTAYL